MARMAANRMTEEGLPPLHFISAPEQWKLPMSSLDAGGGRCRQEMGSRIWRDNWPRARIGMLGEREPQRLKPRPFKSESNPREVACGRGFRSQVSLCGEICSRGWRRPGHTRPRYCPARL